MLNKHQNALLMDFKQDLIEVLSLLFKKLANELIDGNGDIRMIPSNQKIKDSIIDMMRSIRYQNDVQLIKNDDKRRIFSGFNDLNLIFKNV